MRHTATIGATALAVLFAMNSADAQQRATERVPNFLAVSFFTPGESKLGADIAEAVRQRMLRHFPMPPIKTLRVLRREEINNTLLVSGYSPDTVISIIDLGILGRQMGAGETMDGAAKRTAQGVEARARFYFNNNMSAPEVLPVVVEKDAEAVGKKLADLYIQARKELPAYERCRNALIQNQPDEAIVAAREAQQQYPQGVLGRACLLTAYSAQYKNFGADSILRLGNEIIAIDPQNTIAIGQLADAYRAKNDTAKAVGLISKLDSLIVNDLQQSESLIDILMNLGAPEQALDIVERRLQDNPGEVSLLERKWKILQSTNQWKRAIAAGEEMVKFDTSKADTTYFRRQIGAAIQDSQPQLSLQYMAKATAKFPRDVRLLQAYLGELRRQGQLAQAIEVAKQVVIVDPKTPLGYATVVSLYTQAGQADSAVAFAKQALTGADSATKDEIGQGLLGLIRPALAKAQADTTSPSDVQKANWSEVLKLSAKVDSMVPMPNTAFYMSVAAFYVAQHGVANLTEVAKTNRPQACTMLKEASANLLIVDLNMSRGGRVDPGTAGALLQATTGMKPGIEQARKQLGCK